MGLQIVTPASVLPVSLAEARDECRVEDTSFDTMLTRYVAGACDRIATLTLQPMGATVFALWLDEFADALELPRWPVTAVAGIEYVDTAGAAQTADPALYTLDTISKPAWAVLNEGEAWPETMSRVNAVSVTFTAGWTTSTLPPRLRDAVLAEVRARFERDGVGLNDRELLTLLSNDLSYGF